jgi:hypothetical protein
MSCSGLHCAGCAGGVSVPPVAFAAAFGLAWVAENIIAVASVSVVSGALAVAAVRWLMAWSDRRDERRAAAGPLLYVRSEVIGGGQPQAAVVSIAPAVVFNFYGPGGKDMAARVIRTAIPEQARIEADRL